MPLGDMSCGTKKLDIAATMDDIAAAAAAGEPNSPPSPSCPSGLENRGAMVGCGEWPYAIEGGADAPADEVASATTSVGMQ